MKKYIFSLLAITMIACVDDEGNYIYTELNKVTVDGVESRYNLLSRIDTLRIEPVISGTIDGDKLDNYDFEWHICETDNSSSSSTHTHTVISKEKDLEWPVDLNAGDYLLYFVVTDNETGLQEFQSTSLKVATSYTRGYVILGDVVENGVAGLDMLVMPVDRDTVMIEEVFDNSKLQLRNAEKIFWSGAYSAGGHTDFRQAMWIGTGDGTHRVDTGDTYEDFGEFNDLAIIETDFTHETPMKVRDLFPHQAYGSVENRSQRTRGYITDDLVVFTNTTTNKEYYTAPCNRYNAYTYATFKPYPLAFCGGRTSYTSVPNNIFIYDMDNDCFARISYNYVTGTHCVKPTDYSSDAFPFDNKAIGRSIVYGENTFGPGNYGYSYAIMKDTEDNLFIYRWQMTTSTYSYTKSMYEVDLAKMPDFDKASHYMFSSYKTAVLWSVGSRLYQYDYTRDQICYRDFDADITMLKPDYSSGGDYATVQFFVSTYNPTTKGKLYKLYTGWSNNEVSFIEPDGNFEWDSRLNIKDIVWRNAK